MPLLVKMSTSPAKSCGYPWLLILSYISAIPKTQLSNHGFRVQYKQQHPGLGLYVPVGGRFWFIVSHFFIHFLCLHVESQDISKKEVTYAAV
ncbi:hypothetical protein AMTRI_Chr04g188150 [Amborella trichopoda]